MKKLFNDAKDKNVSATYIYGKTGTEDTKAYVDEACTVQMKTSELKEAILKRALIVIGDAIYVPVGFTVSSNIGSVNYITPNASKATSADISTLTAASDLY